MQPAESMAVKRACLCYVDTRRIDTVGGEAKVKGEGAAAQQQTVSERL